MKEEPNPYAPPRATVDAPVAAAAETGHGWRIEGDRLLIRDGAVLPMICILGGDPSLPLERSWLRQDPLPGIPSRKKVWIDVFESRHAFQKQRLRLFGCIMLGLAGGFASSIFMTVDYSATLASILVPCFVVCLGFVGVYWQCRNLPRLTKDRDGWYRVESLAPSVLARFKEIGGGSSSCPFDTEALVTDLSPE